MDKREERFNQQYIDEQLDQLAALSACSSANSRLVHDLCLLYRSKGPGIYRRNPSLLHRAWKRLSAICKQ